MVSLASLWLPILLSAIFVFFASSIIHMVLKYHNSDYGKLDAEAAIRDALRPHDLKPGFYAMPHLIGVDWKDPAVKESLERGPNAYLTVMPKGMFNMGKTLGLWFVHCLVISAFVAWVAAKTIAPGTEYMEVFCIVALVGFAAHALASPSESIWFHRPWLMTAKHMFDGLIYALLTAGTFGWLWPAM